MIEYVVMCPADNEAERVSRTGPERQATFDVDFEFGQLLAARGGAVTGGTVACAINERSIILYGA